MTWLVRALSSSIGKKQIVAVSGLLLCVYLVVHLAANLLLFAGPETYDGYAEALESQPWLLIPIEIVLAALFLAHIATATRLAFENRRARGPQRYAVHATRGAETPASATMVISGAIVLVFLVIHVASFKFGERIDGSLYKLVMASFQESTAYTVWYVVASAVLGFHLSHGFQSAFRTLGFQHPRYTPVLVRVGIAFAIIIGAGFAILPVYARYFAPEVAGS